MSTSKLYEQHRILQFTHIKLSHSVIPWIPAAVSPAPTLTHPAGTHFTVKTGAGGDRGGGDAHKRNRSNLLAHRFGRSPQNVVRRS